MAQSACVATVGAEYEIDKRLWIVTGIEDDQVNLRCASKALEEEYSFFEFNAAVYEGDIKIPGFAVDSVPIPDFKYADLPKNVKESIYRKYAYVRRYSIDKLRRSVSTEDSVDIVAKKLDDISPPSTRTVERWYERWLEFDEHWMGFIPKSNLAQASTRLNPIVDKLMIEAIESLYLVQNSNETYESIQTEIKVRLSGPEYAFLNEREPSKSTIKRRIDQVYGPIEVVRRREGEEAAKRLEEALGVPEKPTRILQCVEIDETIADCFIVDEYGIPIGRPTLVLVVDVYSKMIVGVYVTFQSPSAPVVLQAIKMAILPKDTIISDVDDLVGDWPCFGIPESIRTDNIRHYLSGSFDEAMFDLQIEQEQSRVRKPKGKAAVERSFLKINQTLLNRLPGYVETIESRIRETNLDPQKTAILTLEDFKAHLYRWVVNEHNYKQTDGLGKRRPIDVWNESFAMNKPRNNRSLSSLDVTLLPTVKERTIQATKGIAFNKTQYTSMELMRLRAKLFGKINHKKNFKSPTIKFRWNPDDLGYIWVLDPDTKEYFQVWTNDKGYHGLTEPLYKCAKELQLQIRRQDGERIDVQEAVCRTKHALAEMVGGKHKISEKKRLAAVQSKLDQKKKDEPFVVKGDDFEKSINSGDALEVVSSQAAQHEPDFGPSDYLED